MTELKHQDFVTAGTKVFPSGYDNRDPVRGYHKEIDLENSAVASVLAQTDRQTPTREVGAER